MKFLFLAALAASLAAQQQTPPTAILLPTNHPRLPGDLTQLWLAPVRPALPAPALAWGTW